MVSLITAPKPIVLCADDYALNDSVSQGIVELARHQRISATSVMSLSPLWEHHAPALRELKDAIDVGLHLDWTSEFARKVGWGQGLPAMMWHSLRGGLDATRVREAIERQFDAFEKAWQSPPDHVDGHQHIQQFDGLREVLCEVLVQRYGQSNQKPWLRISQTHKAGFKGALISWMGANSLSDWALALLAALLLGLVAVEAAAQPPSAGPAPVLRGITGYASPFVKLPGTPVSGYSIEVWQEVARRLGVETAWTVLPDLSDAAQLEAVAQGRADVAISALAITAERDGAVDFTVPYFQSGLQVLVATGGENEAWWAAILALAPGELLGLLGAGGAVMLLLAQLVVGIVSVSLWVVVLRLALRVTVFPPAV
jgi:hypothetical protein